MEDRQSKIIATLGPSTDGEKAMERLIVAGVNVVRLNLSHGNYEQLEERVALTHKLAKKHKRYVATLFDLQGPKIRIGNFAEGSITLKKGDPFNLIVGMDAPGDQEKVGVTYAGLVNDCKKGDVILLDDGRITMEVVKIEKKALALKCKVLHGGVLKDRKGLNKQGGGISAESITGKDRQDIKKAAELEADYVAVSFVNSADDINLTRKLLTKVGSTAQIIAKIETADAVRSEENLVGIIKASDGIMIARGDLGVEIGEPQLIALQKNLIALCLSLDRVCITATQMMETMIENPLPTRAEVFDVANAVLDGSDAVMLSAETASGKHPHLVVETMARVCAGADSYHGNFTAPPPPTRNPAVGDTRINRKIAREAVHTANTINKVTALVSLTESGSTVLYMSRMNTKIPIYGLSRHPKTLRRMALYRDVIPLFFKQPKEQAGLAVLDFMLKNKLIAKGERIVLTSGMHHLVTGGTNVLRILEA